MPVAAKSLFFLPLNKRSSRAPLFEVPEEDVSNIRRGLTFDSIEGGSLEIQDECVRLFLVL